VFDRFSLTDLSFRVLGAPMMTGDRRHLKWLQR
jgi:hypothetical protein